MSMSNQLRIGLALTPHHFGFIAIGRPAIGNLTPFRAWLEVGSRDYLGGELLLLRFSVRLLLLLILSPALVTGCYSNKSARIADAVQRDVVVVPVKGQSIVVSSELLGTVVLEGLPAAAVEQAVTSGQLAKLVERLNAEGSAFRPEIILAEECHKLIQSSQKVRFHTVTLRSEPLLLPGGTELKDTNAQPFKLTTKHGLAWYRCTLEWLKTPPVEGSRYPVTGPRSALALEGTLIRVFLNPGKKMVEAIVAIRVVDLDKCEILAKQFTIGTFKVRPMTEDSAFDSFEEDFRHGLHKTAHQALKALKLL